MPEDVELKIAALSDALEERENRIIALEAIVVALIGKTDLDPGTVMDLIGNRVSTETGDGAEATQCRVAAKKYAAALMSEARDALCDPRFRRRIP